MGPSTLLTIFAALLLCGVIAGCSQSPPPPAMRYAPIRDPSGAIRPHPFLFFTSDDLPRLREEARTTHRAQFARLQAWAKLFASFEPLPAAKLPNDRDVMQVYYENAASYLFNMSLLYTLTGDDADYRRAEKWLMAFASYPVETDGGYFIGAYAFALAAGYDMLYPQLTGEQRVQVRDHLAAVLERGKVGTKTDWWAGLLLHHDHWLPSAGLCVGALALVDGTPAADARLKFFTDHMQRAMDAVGDDGSWTEGVAQWNYALAMLAIYFDARKHVTGEDLFHTPRIAKSIAYRLYQWLPGDRYIYHHDSFPNGRYNILGSASSHLLRKLAAEENSGLAQWLAEQDEPVDFKRLDAGQVAADWLTSRNHLEPADHAVGWTFLWYDPAIKPTAPTDALPNHVLFPNQGLVVLRSGWQPEDTVFTFTCAPVGGHAGRDTVLAGDTRLTSNLGHIHALSGAFNLWSHGNYLAAPPGYSMRESNNENTLTIEGTDQSLDPRANATLLHTDFARDYAYLAGDATATYPADANLKRWVRHVAWLAPGTFIIADELEATHASARGKDTIWRLDYIPEINQAAVDPQTQTARINSRTSEQLGALAIQFLSPDKLQLHDAAVRHQWRELPSNVVAGLRLDDAIVKSKDGWVAYGQLRATAHDLFKDDPRQNIVAVLTALPNRSTAAPVSRLIDAPHAIGAVVDEETRSRAAVFLLGDWQPSAAVPLRIEIAGKRELQCLIFGLPPGSTWDAAIAARPAADGTACDITLVPGKSLQATDGGVVSVSTSSRLSATPRTPSRAP